MRSGRCGAGLKTRNCAANCARRKDVRHGHAGLRHRSREEYDEDFRRDYFEWHIHYHLASDEKRGIAKFCELLRKHNLGPVFEPKFVS
jgi:predicted solute-binding protein